MGDNLQQIESDLTQSFEQFRLAEGDHMSGSTSASSMLAAKSFINRVVAYCNRENRVRIRRIALEARKDTAKHVDTWLKSDIDHHDLQRIVTRMVEGNYDYESDK